MYISIKNKAIGRLQTVGFIACLFCSLFFSTQSLAGDPRGEVKYPGAAGNIFYFLHVTDIHVGHACSGQSAPNLRVFLSLVESKVFDPSFVASTGDLTDGATCFQPPGLPCTCGAPDGPIAAQWEDYAGILAGYPKTREIYYDLPGNHDRYGSLDKAQTDWTGETGWDGYAFLGVRGSQAPFLNARSVGLEGQFHWKLSSPDGQSLNLFQALNTNDESGIAFGHYMQMGTINSRGPISDMPVLSSLELADAYQSLSAFRALSNSGLAFLFGHHALSTEDAYPELPGLYDEAGLVGGLLSRDTAPGAVSIELQAAGGFPPAGRGWINTGLGNWDEFTWTGKQGNTLTGCTGIEAAYGSGSLTAADRPDRGAGEIIRYGEQYRVSAYLYGHTHRPGGYVYWAEDPLGSSARVLAMNTGSLMDRWFRIVAVDNGGMSTITGQVGSWPLVLITAPVDSSLAGGNPFYAPIPASSSDNIVRALVFYPPEAKDLRVEFTASGGALDKPCMDQGSLQESPNRKNLFQGSLDISGCGLDLPGANPRLNITVTASFTDPAGGGRVEGSHRIAAMTAGR